MPIYEYKCESCGNSFEVMESFDSNNCKVCEKCGNNAHRVMSSSSFQLKGGGWYSDGYSSSGKPCGESKGGCGCCKH